MFSKWLKGFKVFFFLNYPSVFQNCEASIFCFNLHSCLKTKGKNSNHCTHNPSSPMTFYSSDYKIEKIFFSASTFKGCLELPLLILTIFISQIVLKVAYFLSIYIEHSPGTTNRETKYMFWTTHLYLHLCLKIKSLWLVRHLNILTRHYIWNNMNKTRLKRDRN